MYDNDGRDKAYEEDHGSNYATGNGLGYEFRSFFVFDLPDNLQRVTSATLSAENPDSEFSTAFPYGIDVATLELYDVISPIDSLVDGSGVKI